MAKLTEAQAQELTRLIDTATQTSWKLGRADFGTDEHSAARAADADAHRAVYAWILQNADGDHPLGSRTGEQENQQ